MTAAATSEPIQVTLPTLHDNQVEAFHKRTRFYAVRCGRRWGKTLFGATVAADRAIKGQRVGWFAPEHKFLYDAWLEISNILAPLHASSNRNDGVFNTVTGGRVDFWSLENERAGRSRRYHHVFMDEISFAKMNMEDIWRLAIRPTLVDYRGTAWALSTPQGSNEESFFWRICKDPTYGFTEHHAPTSSNPLISKQELADIQAKSHPLVWKQEYLAEFVDWSGVRFFSIDNLLVDKQPVAYPKICEKVFVTIDSAMKTGQQHDGTAVCYWAYSPHIGHSLVLLDWDLVQIEGALLESWLPSVFQNLEHYARACHARYGSIGAFIEDAASGTILIQQAQRRGWPAQAIESKLTSLGKDERALSVSGYVYRGMVKLSDVAYNKEVSYHDTTKNHLVTQVTGFKIGQKRGDDNREDDLLDTFCYGVAIALGDSEGF